MRTKNISPFLAAVALTFIYILTPGKPLRATEKATAGGITSAATFVSLVTKIRARVSDSISKRLMLFQLVPQGMVEQYRYSKSLAARIEMGHSHG